MDTLRDIGWKISYGPHDDRMREFFIRAIAAIIRHDRAAGYFSITMLAVTVAWIAKLIANDDNIRLVCGADMFEADVEANSRRRNKPPKIDQQEHSEMTTLAIIRMLFWKGIPALDEKELPKIDPQRTLFDNHVDCV